MFEISFTQHLLGRRIGLIHRVNSSYTNGKIFFYTKEYLKYLTLANKLMTSTTSKTLWMPKGFHAT